MSRIYHLTTKAHWEAELNKSAYSHPSLTKEGFIHLSTEEQLLESAFLHFSAEQEILAIEIAAKKVKAWLKWEASRGGKMFPHIYHSIPFEAILDIKILQQKADGSWEWA